MGIPSAPYLQFDFRWKDRIAPMVFRNPVECIVAHRLEEVRPCLRAVQEGLQRGLYAAGYVSYETAPAFDTALRVRGSSAMPLLWFGLFQAPVVAPPSTTTTETADAIGPNDLAAAARWRPTLNRTQYAQKIGVLKEAIASGAAYQINFTFPFLSDFVASENSDPASSDGKGDDFAFYGRLRAAQQADYSAYLHLGRFRILSVSPELFFYRRGTSITTRPMKGTAPRGRWQEEDLSQAAHLERSEKERAENIMIVDLLRNDLGRFARIGSVRVSELFTVERYPTVLQMTSTIEAETDPELTLEEIFAALFPCGSVTGAPKVAAMGFIADLENAPRGVYCGAIGFASPGGEAIFNVAIRTVVVDAEGAPAAYGVGSGITWDSTASGEYAEIVTKAAVLTERPPAFELLETLRLENGRYSLLDRHLARLADSAAYFNFPINLNALEEALEIHARRFPEGTWRVRLLLSSMGAHQIQGTPLEPLPLTDPLPVGMAAIPVSRTDRFLYHKTTNRVTVTRRRGDDCDLFDLLLVNEEGELTEFTRGNLIVDLEGDWWTPPRESGLLAGTMRAELLAQHRIRERLLTFADLQRASRLYFINSLRGIVPVTLRS